MRIIEEQQLDFDDLMMSPKRSTLNSRSEVNLFRDFEWVGSTGKHMHLNCIPIIVANMGTIGIPQVAKIAAKRGFMCAMEKHIDSKTLSDCIYELKEAAIQDGLPEDTYTQRIVPTIGMKEDIKSWDKWLIYSSELIKCICIDIPNGYIPNFIKRIKETRSILPDVLIFAGNVVTGDVCQDIILAGGNVAKVGIGPGCFIGSMKVLTKNGLKKIQDIDIGEYVLTHNGIFEKVINKFIYNTHRHIIDINGIKCTPNHKFYVAKIKDLTKINDKNYKDYCIWIEAKDLDTTKYKLVKITLNQN